MANALVPSVESNGHTVNVCDPFSDEFLSVQRPPAPSMGHVPPPQPPMHAGFYQKQPFRPPYDPTVVAFSKPWPEAPNESPLSSNYRASMPPPPPPPNAHAPSAAAAAAAVAQYGSPHSSSAASSFHPSQTSPRMVIPQNNAPPDAVNRMPPYPPQVSPLEMPNVHMAAPRSRSQFGVCKLSVVLSAGGKRDFDPNEITACFFQKTCSFVFYCFFLAKVRLKT